MFSKNSFGEPDYKNENCTYECAIRTQKKKRIPIPPNFTLLKKNKNKHQKSTSNLTRKLFKNVTIADINSTVENF